MSIHLNIYTQNHLAETIENIQMQFNTSKTNSAPVKAVVKIYDALLKLLQICRIDAGTYDYIKTMVCNHDFASNHTLEEYVLILQDKIKQSPDGFYPADFALRCLMAVLRNGQLIHQIDNRAGYQRLLGLNKISEAEKLKREESLFEPVALDLIEIVSYYYQRGQNLIAY